MNYKDGAFCDTLEAIRKRLSDLRAVLDSECYNQVEPKNHHFSCYQKQIKYHQHKNRKLHHHHHHYHHNNNLSNKSKHRSHHKKYTDKIGRPLYARAIPIEKDYLLNRIEMVRLMKNSKKCKREAQAKVSVKQKTPILFPYEEIELKKSEKASASDYYDNYSEYDYSESGNDDYDNNDHNNNDYSNNDYNNNGYNNNGYNNNDYNNNDYNDNDYNDNDYNDNTKIAKQNAKKKSNKKEIIYLKTYQANERKKKHNNEPQIIQEKGKIIYFDPNDEKINDNEIVNIDFNRINLKYTHNKDSKSKQIKKGKKKSQNLDPIVPIADDSNAYLKSNKVSKIKKENQEKFDDNHSKLIDNDNKENQKLSNKRFNQKQAIRQAIKQNLNEQSNHQPYEKANKIKYTIKQKKMIIKTNKISNEQPIIKEVRNQKIVSTENKLDDNNYFTFKMCIKSQPMCIVIGDINSDTEKLYSIINLIKANPSLNFIFIGDLISNISDASPLADANWKCLSLLSQFFYGQNKLSFKSDNDTNSKTKSYTVSLPSAFNEIHFGIGNFDEIKNRVKFIAGNAEFDILSSINEGCEIISDGNTQYVFGGNKWKKTFTFEKMCLLYKYLKSCFKIIKFEIKRPNNHSKSYDFVDTVYFSHSNDAISQEESGIGKGKYIVVTARAFIINKSLENYYDKENENDDENPNASDNKFVVVSFDKNIGFSMNTFSLPDEFQ